MQNSQFDKERQGIMQALYAVAVSGSLSDAGTYAAMTYFIKRGIDFSDRIKEVHRFWQTKEWKERPILSVLNPFTRRSPPEFFNWENDTPIYEFYKAASLQGSYDEAFVEVINFWRRHLGMLISDLSYRNKGSFLNERVAWVLWSITRTTWLRRELLSLCQEMIALVPPPSDQGFWRSDEILALSEYPNIKFSAQMALVFLKLTTRWDDALKVAQWLRGKRSKFGYWNEYDISNTELRKLDVISVDDYKKCRLRPTCFAAELMKRLLLDDGNDQLSITQEWILKQHDLSNDQLSITQEWILKQYDLRGLYDDFPPVGQRVANMTVIALETIDMLSLPAAQAFVFPETSKGQIDRLCDLPNKDYFITVFKPVCNLVQQRKLPFALPMMDLVKFKAINDRWGGDEFIVLFKPSVEKSEAKRITIEMLDAWSYGVSEIPEQFHPFVRVGFAYYPDDIKDPQKLEDLASARLKTLKGKKGLSRSLICDNGI
jgi:GGDEF domain-containing protein